MTDESASQTSSDPLRDYPGLEKLMCAAASNSALAASLLGDPIQTLARLRDTVQLSATERELALAVRNADTIHSFAAQLNDLIHVRTTGSAHRVEPMLQQQDLP